MTPSARLGPWVAVPAVVLFASPVAAYTVGSSLSGPCHERITGRTFVELTREFAAAEEGVVPVPQNDTWQLLAGDLIRDLGVDPAELDEMQRFILLSLVVGVRSPDTDGHSLLDLRSLRSIHGDPGDEGQYAHCLRGRNDDGTAGDAAAVAGTRRLILDRIAEARDHLGIAEGRRRVIRVAAYLDFYGLIEVQVYAPFYYVGQALHALQDGFSHALRSDDDGLHTVIAVLNYIDAISDDFDERRDGLAHSDSLDRCGDPAADDLTEAARAATRDFVLAVRAEFSGADPAAVEAVLDRWLTYRPGCDHDNDYCGGGRWLDLLRREQTRPYLEAFFGCAVPAAPPEGTGLVLLLAAALLALRPRRAPPTARTPGGRAPCRRSRRR